MGESAYGDSLLSLQLSVNMQLFWEALLTLYLTLIYCHLTSCFICRRVASQMRSVQFEVAGGFFVFFLMQLSTLKKKETNHPNWALCHVERRQSVTPSVSVSPFFPCCLGFLANQIWEGKWGQTDILFTDHFTNLILSGNNKLLAVLTNMTKNICAPPQKKNAFYICLTIKNVNVFTKALPLCGTVPGRRWNRLVQYSIPVSYSTTAPGCVWLCFTFAH